MVGPIGKNRHDRHFSQELRPSAHPITRARVLLYPAAAPRPVSNHPSLSSGPWRSVRIEIVAGRRHISSRVVRRLIRAASVYPRSRGPVGTESIFCQSERPSYSSSSSDGGAGWEKSGVRPGLPMLPGPTAPIRRPPGVPSRSDSRSWSASAGSCRSSARPRPRPRARPGRRSTASRRRSSSSRSRSTSCCKMTQLLADQVKKQPAPAPAVEKLQEQAATQEARIQQGARRDQELAQVPRRPRRAARCGDPHRPGRCRPRSASSSPDPEQRIAAGHLRHGRPGVRRVQQAEHAPSAPRPSSSTPTCS